MRFRTIKDIIDWTRAFHDALAAQYESLAVGHEQERAGLLLQYLSHHERTLSAALQHYEEDQEHLLLKKWYAPDLPLPEDLSTLCRKLERVDTSGVLAMALQFHDLLIDLYANLSSHAPNEEIKTLFESISNQETRDKLKTVRDAVRLEDI